MQRVRGCRLLWAGLLVLAQLGAARAARAHEFPTPFELLFDASDARRVVVALRPGLALTESAGESWNFLCGAVTGVAGPDAYPVALSAGRLFIGTYTGIFRDDGYGCGWSRIEGAGLPAGRVAALHARPDGAIEALTRLLEGGHGLFVSLDQGRSWTAQGMPLPAAAVPTGLRSAPSATATRYVAGSVEDGSGPALWVTTDDGASWSEKRLPGGFRAEVVAVHPGDAARLVVWLASFEPQVPDRLLLSEDAGDTYLSLPEIAALGGIAWAGSSLWIGSRDGGLFRVHPDGALEVVQDSWPIGCLAYHDGKLWICSRDDAGRGPFAVASSADDGETFVPFMQSAQVRRLRTCGNTVQAMSCSAEWNQWKNDVFGSTLDPPLLPEQEAEPVFEPEPVNETEPERAAGQPSSGCQLRRPEAAGSGHAAAILILVCFSAVARRRRALRVATGA